MKNMNEILKENEKLKKQNKELEMLYNETYDKLFKINNLIISLLRKKEINRNLGIKIRSIIMGVEY